MAQSVLHVASTGLTPGASKLSPLRGLSVLVKCASEFSRNCDDPGPSDVPVSEARISTELFRKQLVPISPNVYIMSTSNNVVTKSKTDISRLVK